MCSVPFDRFVKINPLAANLFSIFLGLLLLAGTDLSAQSTNISAYTFTTFAGSAGLGSSDGVGSAAQFNTPKGVAADNGGNIYVADTFNYTIRRISSAGVVSTIAGFAGSPGTNDGAGANARFGIQNAGPENVAVDQYTNVYVTDVRTIRKITPVGTNWIVTTIAGSVAGTGSTDGTNSSARFSFPRGIAVGTNGVLYVVDNNNNTIRKITPQGTNWVVTTIAGLAGSRGNVDGTNSAARFGAPGNGPRGITIDHAGNLYVADWFNYTIRKIAPVGTNWVVTTIAGLAGVFGDSDGTGTNAHFFYPADVAVDAAGNLFVPNSQYCDIKAISPSGTNWVSTTFAGFPGSAGYTDGTGTNSHFNTPSGIATDPLGNIYVADTYNHQIRKISAAAVVRSLAGGTGTSTSSDGTGSDARFKSPSGVTSDRNGNIYVSDTQNHTIRQITSAGSVSTVAGLAGSSGSLDGAGGNARFYGPAGLTVDTNGNIFVCDENNYIIRKITPAGLVSTIAGLAGNSGGTDGTNNVARFNFPRGIVSDPAGNLFVADQNSYTIRKMSQVGTNWVVTTIAGLTGTSGTNDGVGNAARFGDAGFGGPAGITIDAATNLYVADFANHTIRKLTPVGTNWSVSTIAGLAKISGSSGGTNSGARFNQPMGITMDNSGSLIVTEFNVRDIRKVTPVGTNWVVSTIGGVPGVAGSSDGAGSAALFNLPEDVTSDGFGNLFIADAGNNVIRKGVFTAYAATNIASLTPPTMTGSLNVTLLPPEANGQWRVTWEQAWHNSGVIVSNLAQDNYVIQFRAIPGYLTIQTNFPVSVLNGATTSITNQYYPTLADGSDGSFGTLTVNIGPNQLAGAAWRLLGENSWRTPGSTATNLLPDVYFVEFQPVSGRAKPATQSVRIYPGLPTIISANYLLAASAPANVLLPFAVPQNNISNLNAYPFGFNGQLQSDLGYGSGVAVQANVVLTAAHLIFNDQTLSYVSQIYWYFQRETGSFEPEPQAARGWYVLSGYAAQRTNDLQSGLYGPDQSTPQSRNLDVAALYFLSPMAGGSYGGYLPSDATPNPWLSGSSLKMLVGYPVDGSMFGDASIVPGMMYQTDPQPFALNVSTDPVANQRVYTASWFLSYPGNSGGPVYAQFNGYYYPAGIYLGTLFNGAQPYASAVRAIDSDVVNLIIRAGTLGDSGTNNSGGGVITIIPSQAITASNPGYMQWQLAPASAVAAGAGWKLQGDASYSSATNYVRVVTSTNAVVVQFKPINGWNLPTNQAVAVLPGQITTYVAYYTPSNSMLQASATGIAITGTVGTMYRIERSTSLANGSWAAVSTNTITTNGFNFVLPKPTTNGPSFYRAVWLP